MTISEQPRGASVPARTMSGGHAAAATLSQLGVRAAFGIPGVHNLGIYDGLIDHPEIRHTVARHEQGAAFMADGYARAIGETAAVLVTTGPGVLNALTALAESYADSQPVLLIATVGESELLGQYKGTLHEILTRPPTWTWRQRDAGACGVWKTSPPH